MKKIYFVISISEKRLFLQFYLFSFTYNFFFPTFFISILSYLSGTFTFVFADISGRNFLSSFAHFWAEPFSHPEHLPPLPPCIRACGTRQVSRFWRSALTSQRAEKYIILLNHHNICYKMNQPFILDIQVNSELHSWWMTQELQNKIAANSTIHLHLDTVRH